MHHNTHAEGNVCSKEREQRGGRGREAEREKDDLVFQSLMFLKERIRSDNSISSLGTNAIGMVQPSAC